MNTILKLFWVQFKVRFGLSVLKYNMKHNSKELFKAIGLGILIIIAFLNLFGVYTFMSFAIIQAVKMLNHPEIVLTFTFLASQILTLIFGLFFIIGHLFLAKDNEFLASLPIPQWKVFASKFLHVYLSELLIAAALLLPPVVIYGFTVHTGFIYYLKAVFIILFTPFIPLTISALLSLVLMRIVGKSRHRDLLTVVFSFILIAGIFIGQLYINSHIPAENFEEVLKSYLQSGDLLVNQIGRLFPPSIWATKALELNNFQGLLYFLGYIISSAAALLFVLLISNRIYFKGALAQLESAKGKKSNKKARISESSSSPVLAYFKKEWKVIYRSPIIAMNSLFGVIMAPILIIIPMFAKGSINDPELDYAIQFLSGKSQSYVVLGIVLLMAFISSVNPAAATMLSREGRAVWICKTIPQNPKTQVMGKFLTSISIPAATAVISVICAMVSLKLSFLNAVFALILSLLITLPITAVTVIVDLLRPKLVWNNEQEVIKQNMNVILSMLAGIVVTLFIGGLGAITGFVTMSVEIGLIGSGIIALAVGIGLYFGMLAMSSWSYRKISD